MKILQTYLSALVDLILPRFDPKNPEAEIPVRNWLEILGILLIYGILFAVGIYLFT